jgi:adenylate kinase
VKLPKVIYMMGPPGAGKGTQAALLCEQIGYVRFSTGDAFRAVAAQDTPLGREVKETIDNGYLAPPSMAAEIVTTEAHKNIAAGDGIVFDGTPRTEEEAALVDDFFIQHKYGRPLVIYLDVHQNEMVRRNSRRKFCLGIQGGFAIIKEGDGARCEALGGHIGVRPDDEPGKFTARWQQFMDRTYPVVEKYRAQGIVHEVDGMKSIEDVHADVMKIIDGLRNG